MKRVVAVLALACLFPACKMGVPGVTCESSSECENGWCDRGICTECSPSCTAYETCSPTGTCDPAFASVTIESPGSGATVQAPFKVTAKIARQGTSVLAPPAALALSAKPATGDAEPFTLTRDGETLTYSKTIAPKSTGGYSLTASFTEAGLSSAAVPVTVKPTTCEPACTGLQECVGTTCVPAFDKIEITSPKADAKFSNKAAGIPAEVQIVRSAGAQREFPASVELSGAAEGGQTASATLAGSGDGTYSGKLLPTVGGKWTLKAKSTEVEAESAAVSVIVEFCPQTCGAWEECAAGKCVAAFTGIAISSPKNGDTVGASAEVRAVLTRRAGGTLEAPASVEVETTKGGTTAKLTLAKDAAKPLEYTATWSAAEEGTYSLKASSPAVAQPSASVGVTVDKTAPVLEVSVVPAPARNAWELDEKSANKDTEFKRNEKAKVQVKTVATDVVAASVKVTVSGPTSGSLEVAVHDCPTLPPAGSCWEAEVELGNPALVMHAFRGAMGVAVRAGDAVGNQGTGAATIQVTRFKWKVDPDSGAPGKTLRTAPAIGNAGTVYFATSTGKVVALSPSGAAKWSVQAGGAITASVAVHDVDLVETVFVAGTTGGAGAVWALNESNVATLPAPICSDGSNAMGSIAVTDVALGTETQARPTALVAFSQKLGRKCLRRPPWRRLEDMHVSGDILHGGRKLRLRPRRRE
ncbi:MAG: hypothetical protein QM765_27170 [Myxococcales bacterium]